jgi:hypothetical protein
MKSIESAKEFSNQKIELLRGNLKTVVSGDGISIITCGSFARREASMESDLDYFILTKSKPEESNLSWSDAAHSCIKNIVPNQPATDGAFANVVNREEILTNIGGNDDSNKNITRRMLLLLEGEWLYDAKELKSLRKEILEKYIAKSMTDHQLALFLLNDVIRYYRTMAVDYEFKTVGSEIPKPWAVRNIKLIFSRKLLYASGLFSVAVTADRSRDKKIELLERLFDLTAIDRMLHICGGPQMSQVLKAYNYFLEKLEDNAMRTHLNLLTKEQRNDPDFRELKNEGHHFNHLLMQLFENTFGLTHPIRRAIVF